MGLLLSGEEGKGRKERGEEGRGGTLDPHNVGDRLTPLNEQVAPCTTNLAMHPTAGCCHLANLTTGFDSNCPSMRKVSQQ